MSPLREALAEYLAVRRALGYKLERTEKLLSPVPGLSRRQGQRPDHRRARARVGDAPRRRAALARDAAGGGPRVRALPARSRSRVEVPAAELLPDQSAPRDPVPLHRRADPGVDRRPPSTLRTAHQTATFQTLFGLLAVTGMRIGEAIALDRDGLRRRRRRADRPQREVREVPRAAAAPDHDQRADALPASPRPPPARGTDRGAAGLERRAPGCWSGTCRPPSGRCEPARGSCRARRRAGRRLHDMRHSFAVNTLLDAYRTDGDAGSRWRLLSTYLGHVDPGKTYWYLHAAPELIALAGGRLERHLGGRAMSTLATSLQAWFTDRLIRERNASPHTIASYRDTIRLLLTYASQHTRHRSLTARISTSSTRRWSARSSIISNTSAGAAPGPATPVWPRSAPSIATACCATPSTPRRSSESCRSDPNATNARSSPTSPSPRLDALIDAPDRSTWTGRRDHAIIILLAQTGLRASELTGLRLRRHPPRRPARTSPPQARDASSGSPR